MADISLKFGVQGDKNMKSALAAINSEIKGLDAEMKLAVAQMQGMDDAEDKNAKTSAILEKQYDANAKKVELLSKRYSDSQSKLDALGKELDEAKKSTGENSEEVQKLQNAYNKQKKATTDLNTELTKAKTKMQDAKNGMDNLGKETKETSQQLEKGVKSTSTFGDTLKAKLTSEAIIAGVKKLAKGLKELAMGAITLSDDLATQAQVTGISVEALQEYNYMAELVDVSVDTITGSLTKLTRNMQTAKSGTGAAAEAFEALGVSFMDAEGNLRSNQDVFAEVVDALGQMENETERDAVAMNLFGKSAQELNPLIKAGSEQIKAYAQEAHEMGYIMSDEVINKNLEASDAYERMKNSITGAKNYIGSQFAPVIQKAAETVTKLVQAARDNEAIVKRLATVLGVAVAALIAYKVATAAASAVTALMAANPVTLLVTALTALAALVALTAKRSDNYTESTKRLIAETDKLSAEISDNAAAYATLEEAKKKAIEDKQGEFSYYEELHKELKSITDENGKVKEGYENRARVITSLLSDALGIEIEMTGNVIKNYQTLEQSIADVIQQKRAEAILSAQEQAYTEALNGRMQAEINLTKAQNQKAQSQAALISNQRQISALENEYAEIAKQMGSGVYTKRQREIDQQIEALKNEQVALTNNVTNAKDNYKAAQEVVATYSYNIQQYEKNLELAHSKEFGKMNTVTADVVKQYQTATKEEKAELDKQYGNILSEAARTYSAAVTVGNQYLYGMRDGVNNWSIRQQTLGQVGSFANSLLGVAQRTLQINSPSKATAQMGRYLMEGFSVGMDDEENNVLRQVKQAGQDILGAFGGTTAGLTTVNGAPAIQSAGGTYVIQLMLDGKQIATSTTSIQAQRQRAYAL